MPSTTVNSVSSDARRTFLPGWSLVPRCRTRMVPAVTLSPPNFLTPRYCGLESRPLREEPTPFLCAMARPLPDLHVSNLDFSELLAVSRVVAIAAPACEAEDVDLLALH